MKQYFLQFDFWGRGINKFYFGCVTADLKEMELIEVCKQVIRDNFADISPEEVTIKVNTLNNVEL